ncbi:hypothetical protein IMZ31_19505 (plasmid) [Pontibacillus sp. ALD_SL1]|uniref:hypothetical protein n=1 Tax=Pontibacillus sp. ALD_SL1 TaxID=2777185 RepID=UPI001A97D0DE|nr:hypothetical protein [Pontibacillus sp. ALD_SL1]QST02738.1 hypothetical protein IMZ31_19505 [Pontibacillus sp. ALD_SL1]
MNPITGLLSFLAPLTGIVGGILVVYGLYLGAKQLLSIVSRKERIKRKRIMERVDRLKESLHIESSLPIKIRLLQAFELQEKAEPALLQKVREDSERVVQEEKGRPYILIGALVAPTVLFIMILASLNEVTVVHMPDYMPLVLGILSFVSIVSKKRILLFFLIAVIGFFIYQHVSGAMQLFLLFHFSYALSKKRLFPLFHQKKRD